MDFISIASTLLKREEKSGGEKLLDLLKDPYHNTVSGLCTAFCIALTVNARFKKPQSSLPWVFHLASQFLPLSSSRFYVHITKPSTLPN